MGFGSRASINLQSTQKHLTRIGLAWAMLMVLGLGVADAQRPSLSVLTPTAGTKNIKVRHLRRISTSFEAAISKSRGIVLVAAGCKLKKKCIADAGKREGSQRTVAIHIKRTKDMFSFTFLMVATANARQLAKRRVKLTKRDLPSLSGKLLLDFIAEVSPPDNSSLGDNSPGNRQPAKKRPVTPSVVATPATQSDSVDSNVNSSLRIRVAKGIQGDGRSVIPVEVEGAPGPRTGELKRMPQLPYLRCDKASVLPATRDVPIALLAPAVSEVSQVRCVVEHRGARASFQIEVRPPKDGLYAAPERFRSETGAEALMLRTFGGQGGGHKLRVAVSAGRASVGVDGMISLVLPEGKAPRTVAILLKRGEDVGVAFVPVTGKTQLQVVVQKKSTFLIRIAGRVFGPHTAKRRVSKIDIEVPPGVRRGVVRATDRKGFSIESVANLRIPQLPRVAAMTTHTDVQPGGKTDVWVAFTDQNGRPAGPKARLEVAAKLGAIGGVHFVSLGLFRIGYTAPSSPGEEELSLRDAVQRRSANATIRFSIAPVEVIAPDTTPVTARISEPKTVSSGLNDRRPGEILIGGYATGSWSNNFGLVTPIHLGAGVGVRRVGSYFDVSIYSGIEGYRHSDRATAVLAGAERTIARDVRAVAFPIVARGRLPLGKRFGVHLGLGIVPTIAEVKIAPGFQPADQYNELVIGLRSQLGIDIKLGPGRVVVDGGFAKTTLAGGLVTGNLEGISASLGYEWWPGRL